MFIDSGKVTSKWGEEPPVITTREELKKEIDIEEWKKLIAQSWRRTEEDWTKKRELGLFILNRRLNNTQLLINGVPNKERLVLFKLFLPISKCINLSFLVANLR